MIDEMPSIVAEAEAIVRQAYETLSDPQDWLSAVLAGDGLGAAVEWLAKTLATEWASAGAATVQISGTELAASMKRVYKFQVAESIDYPWETGAEWKAIRELEAGGWLRVTRDPPRANVYTMTQGET